MTDARFDKTILCVGRLYCDLIFSGVPRLPSYGTEVFASGVGLYPGGGAFITAAHLSELGHRTALAAMLPGTQLKDELLDQIHAAQIDLSLCRDLPQGADLQVTAALLGQNDRAFVTHRSGPACPTLLARDLAQMNVGHLHFGELTTLVDHPDLLDLARELDLTTSLDCAWDETTAPEGISQLISQVDVFLPNEAEANWLKAQGVDLSGSALMVVKRGANGAEAMQGGQHFYDPACAVDSVDTTGAGDAFNAGFLDAWLRGAILPKCLNAGNKSGAAAVQGYGGFSQSRQVRNGGAPERISTAKP